MILAAYPFYAVSIFGVGYFVMARRTFDFIGLAFFATCFYFLPGFFGFVGYPEGVIQRPVPILPETYFVMCFVQAAILLSGIVSDLVPAAPVVRKPVVSDQTRLSCRISTVLAILGAALTWATVGESLGGYDKSLLLQELNRWHLLWTTCATLGAVLAYQRSLSALFFVNLALLLLDLYVGFRVDLVVTLLTVLTLFLVANGPARLVRRWRLALSVLAFALVLFVYKFVGVAIRIADWDLLERQLNNPEALQLIFLYSEPFVVQGILNEVIRASFSVGMDHLTSILYLLVPFSNEFGLRRVSATA